MLDSNWKEFNDLPAEVNDGIVILSVSSSAISEIFLDYHKNEIGIVYHNKPDKPYIFLCENLAEIEERIRTADSVGKLIAHLKTEEILQIKP